jgi:hypothetical protein
MEKTQQLRKLCFSSLRRILLVIYFAGILMILGIMQAIASETYAVSSKAEVSEP